MKLRVEPEDRPAHAPAACAGGSSVVRAAPSNGRRQHRLWIQLTSEWIQTRLASLTYPPGTPRSHRLRQGEGAMKVSRSRVRIGRARRSCALGATAAVSGPRTHEGAAQIKNGGTLTIGLAEDPDALDPTLARTFVGRIVFLHMCEKLYDLNAKLQIVPQLASALPEISKDKLTYTIKIRTGIKFNDGTPLNAEAVKKTLDRHRTLKGSIRASEISPISSVATRRRDDRRPASEDAVLAAVRTARRPRRDGHVAEADRRPRRQLRDRTRSASARSSSRTASRATTSRSSSRRLLRQGEGASAPDRVPDPDRPERADAEPPLG